MQQIERNNYDKQEIIDMLHGKNGSRVISFRYDLLDRNEVKKGELYRVHSGEVSMGAFSTIKRTAKFSLEEEGLVEKTIDRPAVWNDYSGKTWDELQGGI